MVKKHFVTFYSAGTFMAETTTKEIEEWDVNIALYMAKSIKERYGATPYGFKFITKAREDDELDSKQVDSSGMYYITGKKLTLDELIAEHNSSNRILIDNMKCNGWNSIVRITEPYAWTQPLYDEDVVLE